MENFGLTVSFYSVCVVNFCVCWWGLLIFNKSSGLGLLTFLCAMSESYGNDCSASLIDECDSGQYFSSINGFDNQFYLENFDFSLFESGFSSEDSSVTSDRVYSSGSLSALSVTESLSFRISALEDLAGIYQFVVWRVQVC